MKIKKLVLLASSVFLCAWTFEKQSGPGPVQLERFENTLNLEIGFDLRKNDIIYVGAKTKILLTEGKSQIWVGENTVLRVNTLSTNQPSILVESGKIRAQIKSPEANKWKFETRSAVSGIRGTEFFIASHGVEERVCVLEGQVEAEMKSNSSQRFSVPAGKGVQISGGSSRMVDNSKTQVDQWVAETSFEESVPYIPVSYTPASQQYEISPLLSYSVDGTFFYCEIFNPDFNKSTSDSSKNCVRAHLYPSLQIHTAVPVRLTPRVSLVMANQSTTFDAIPNVTNTQEYAIGISEAFASPQWKNWNFQLGFQKFNLTDSLLLSEAKFTNEPLTHLALKATTQFNDQDFTLMLSQGLEGKRTIDGFFPHSLALIDLKVFESRGEFYVLRVDSIDAGTNLRPDFHQTNVGFTMNDRLYRNSFCSSFVSGEVIGGNFSGLAIF